MRVTPSWSAILIADCFLACGGTPEAVPNEPTSTSSIAVVGGTVDTGDPEVVAFQEEFQDGASYDCTAEFISPTMLLTAAHCLFPAPEDPNAAIASYTLTFGTETSAGSTVNVPIANAHPNPNYDPSTSSSDIAVLVLDQPIDGVTPLPLNAEPIPLSMTGSNVFVVGYGSSSPTGTDFGITKQSATVTLQGLTTPGETTEEMLEIGQNGVTACNGDSGGPAIMTFNGIPTLVGIVSFGLCDNEATYTPVDEYITFIEQFGAIEVNSVSTGNAPTSAPATAPQNHPAGSTTNQSTGPKESSATSYESSIGNEASCAMTPVRRTGTTAWALSILALGAIGVRRLRKEATRV